MIKKIRTVYFPNICITFTLVTVTLCILYLIFGGNFNKYPVFALHLLSLIILSTVGCVLVNKIKFRKKIMYPIMELIVNYVVFFGNEIIWGDLEKSDIVVLGVGVLVFYLEIYFRMQKQRKKEATKINKLLQKRKECLKGSV